MRKIRESFEALVLTAQTEGPRRPRAIGRDSTSDGIRRPHSRYSQTLCCHGFGAGKRTTVASIVFQAVETVIHRDKRALEVVAELRAFVRPNLVKAVVEGQLPRGIGIERLRDLPTEWSRQFEALGLNPE